MAVQPSEFSGEGHLHLDFEGFTGEKTFEIIMTSSITLSGLKFSMPANRGMTKIKIFVAEKGMQEPDDYTQVEPEHYFLYYGALPDDDSVIERTLTFRPMMGNKVKIVIVEGKPNPLFKMDLIGLPTEETYASNPVLDPIEYIHS